MDFKSTGSHKFVTAIFADIRAFTRMSSFMVGKMSLCGKTHIAVSEITFERFLPVMNSHMGEEVSFFSECFFASFKLTNERPFTSL